MRTKRARGFALAILFLFWVLPPLQFSPAAEKVSVQDILSNPDKYDGPEVSLQGKAIKIQARASKKGNDYATFTLTDESGKGMNIFTFGHPRIMDGQKDYGYGHLSEGQEGWHNTPFIMRLKQKNYPMP